MSDQEVLYRRKALFSPAIRVCHWLRVLAIVVLTVTGFYIAWPFLMAPQSTDVLVNGWIRAVHEAFGLLLVAITVVRMYLFFFSCSNVERRSIRDALSPKSWLRQIKATFLVGEPPHRGAYEPLQLIGYLAVTLLIIFMCITGLALFAADDHEGFAALISPMTDYVTYQMGGLANVRLWHHYVMWGLIIFVPLHIYLVVWTGLRFRQSTAEAIFSGYSYEPSHKDH